MVLSVATNNVLCPRVLAFVVRELHDKDSCAINSNLDLGRRRSTNDTLEGCSSLSLQSLNNEGVNAIWWPVNDSARPL